MASWYDNVPAPVDANGREVPLDTRELVYKGETREVYCFIYNIGRESWSVGFNGSCGSALNACTLPDSWERLEKDAENYPCDYFGMNRNGSCFGCPAKSDEGSLLMCRSAMTLDIIRRAKALAGVDDDE